MIGSVEYLCIMGIIVVCILFAAGGYSVAHYSMLPRSSIVTTVLATTIGSGTVGEHPILITTNGKFDVWDPFISREGMFILSEGIPQNTLVKLNLVGNDVVSYDLVI